ncbi:MAG: hypothetical protein M3276_04290 [Actinomycetota bacterium]|nr:hypothetical protein [Actinomycetota bacterium]
MTNTIGRKPRILLLPFGVVAMIMLFASAAFACSIFVGVYEVQGNASDQSVKGIGQSWNGCQPGTCMKNMIEGQTAVSSDSAASITVQAYPEPGVAQNRLPDGEYYVTWLNGFTYRSHKVWAVDCMFLGGELERPPQADPGQTGEGITVLGFVNVVGGKLPATTFDLPDDELVPTTETGGINFKKGESSSCIASSADNPNDTWGGGQWGNSVPITVL